MRSYKVLVLFVPCARLKAAFSFVSEYRKLYLYHIISMCSWSLAFLEGSQGGSLSLNFDWPQIGPVFHSLKCRGATNIQSNKKHSKTSTEAAVTLTLIWTHQRNLISCQSHAAPLQKCQTEFINNFLSYPADRQINKSTLGKLYPPRRR